MVDYFIILAEELTMVCKLGHSVLDLSDRDILSNQRNINDLNGSKYLNKKLLSVIGKLRPDLVVLGHADLINNNTLEIIKRILSTNKDLLNGFWIEWTQNGNIIKIDS